MACPAALFDTKIVAFGVLSKAREAIDEAIDCLAGEDPPQEE